MTEKYFDIQKVIARYAPVEKIDRNDLVELFVPPPVELKLLNKTLFDLLFATRPTKSNRTLQFETLGIQFGFVAYKSTIDFKPTAPAKLVIKDLRDRAYIYVDGVRIYR